MKKHEKTQRRIVGKRQDFTPSGNKVGVNKIKRISKTKKGYKKRK